MSVPMLAEPTPDLLYLAILTASLLTQIQQRAEGHIVSTALVVTEIGNELARIRAGGDS